MNGRKATGLWNFQGRDHEINIDTCEDKLTVEVQDVETADQWRASFLTKHIEDITRKTGNFKPIAVFINMLESAVLKSSESVLLQLLTYADLENLRQRRSLGLGGKTTPTSTLQHQQQAKRYLILTYSTEFDRIHYPLALPYVGKPDPVELQETIRHLTLELEKYKSKNSQRSSTSSFIRLQKKYDALLVEKEELERVVDELQQELAEDCDKEDGVMGLKNLIRRMEETSLKEKTKYQRILSKKNEEIRCLSTEVEDLRSSERLLNSRVKSLTSELAMMRRHSPVISRTHSSSNRGRTESGQRMGSGQRAGSSQRVESSRSTGIHYVPVSSHSEHIRRRSSSVENGVSMRNRNTGGSVKNRSRTPSPRAFQRFNPTAYIENKRRLQSEIDTRRNRSRSSSAGSIGGYLGRATPPYSRAPQSRKINLGVRSRNSSVGSCRSNSSRRTSSVESLTENSSLVNNGTNTAQSSRIVRGKRYHESSSSTPKAPRLVKKKQRPNGSTTQLDHSIEIKEIDARLNALQQYMKKSLGNKR